MAPRSEWAPMFLDALSRSGLVRASARAVGVGRRTVYDRRERDPAFAAAWDAALRPFSEGLRTVDRAALATMPQHAALEPLAKLSAQVGAVTVDELEARIGSLEDYAEKLERRFKQPFVSRFADEIRALARAHPRTQERVTAGPKLCGSPDGRPSTAVEGRPASGDPDVTEASESPPGWEPPESMDTMKF